MHRYFRRTPCAIPLLLALAACGEPLQVAPPAAQLQFVMPTPAVIEERVLETGKSSTPPSGAVEDAERPPLPGSRRPSTGRTVAATETPIIRFQRTSVGFIPGTAGATAPAIALADAVMQYFGNYGQHTTSLQLYSPAGGLDARTETFPQGNITPDWYWLQSFVRVQIGSTCGFSAIAHTVHNAAVKTQVVGPFGGDMAQVSDVTYSPQATQGECKQVTYVERTGGEGDSRITDTEWFICYWSVWYDQRGVEVSRQFLYCTPE